jgi:type I restriction enzyme, S subunit
MAPEGWERTPLAEVAKQKIVYGIVQAGEQVEDGVPYIKSSDVGRKIEPNSLSRTAQAIHQKYHRSTVAPGDIVFSLRGNTGATSIVPEELAEANLTQGTARITVSRSFDNRFVRYVLASDIAMRQVLAVAKGSTFTEVSLDALRKISIPHPPLSEQRKIAEILSTWDRAIETAQALLATARSQKRALMQSLLTGKRRFPEFEGQEWKEVRLGDVTTLIVSNVDKKTKDGEAAVRLCNYTDVYKRDTIHSSQDFMEATATKDQIKKFGLKAGDVVITKDSETANDIAMPSYVAETADDLVCGYHLAIVRPGRQVDGRFLKFYFDLPHTRYYFGTRANGAIRFGLTIDGIQGAKLQLPPIEEQERIAGVVAESEVEIITHITDIEKLRAEKKALMQQLLTGKRRVVLT